MIDKMVRHIVGTGKEHKRLRLFAPPARRKQRAAAAALSVCMVFTAMPQTAFAAEGQNGLCEHHLYHTVKCGYTEAVEGHPCEHEHTGDCFTDMLICGYIENEDATASDSNTGHTHTQDCHALDCPHENGEHDKACHYKEAVEGRPCGNVCELCGGPVNNGNSGGGIETVTLVAFGGLEEAVVHQSVPAGTLLEELVLPETLSATAQAGDESPEQVTVPNVTWEPDALYEGAAGSYDFTASAAGYTCAQGVDWPVITVTVEETTPVPDEIDALCAAIDALPTVDELTDNAPGNGTTEFEAWATETRAMLESVTALWKQFLAVSGDASAMKRITDARAEKLAGLNSLAERLGEAKPLANTGATGGMILNRTSDEIIEGYFGENAVTVSDITGWKIITLNADVTVNAMVEFNDTDRDWILDLNGHTLAGAQPVGAVSLGTAEGVTPVALRGGKLSVISAVEGGKLRGGDGDGTYTDNNNWGGGGGNGLLVWGADGVLTLTDNKVTLQGGDGGAGNSRGGQGLYETGGTVTLTGVICRGGNGTGNGSSGYGVYLSSEVTVAGEIKCTAQGGTGANGLYCGTAAAISDGSYTGDWAGAEIDSGQENVAVTGGTFTGGNCGLYVTRGSVQLSGGTFTGDGGSAYAVYNDKSGGTAADLLAENYAYFNGSDQITTGLTEAGLGQNTTITVAQSTITATGGTIESSTEVSAIQGYFGGEGKATVTVNDGQGTIKLKTNVTLDATVTFNDTDRAWTLDLNGHTLAGAQPVDADSVADATGITPVTLTGGKLAVTSTVKGGKLRGGDGHGTYTSSENWGGNGGDGLLMNSTGVLTLTDNKVTIQGGDGGAGDSFGGYGLRAAEGTVTLTDVICQGGNGTGNGSGGRGVALLSYVTVNGEINCTAQGGIGSYGLYCETAATISDGSYTGERAGARIYSVQENVAVTGGTFTGGSYGLHVTSGSVQLSGGTFTGDDGSAYAVYNGNGGGTVADLLAANYAYFDTSGQQITTGLTEAMLGQNTTIKVMAVTTATGGTIESSTEVSAIQGYFGGEDKATVTVADGKGTIKLKTNVTLDATVDFNDTVRDWTLDLNGHTLAGAQPVDADSHDTAKGITPVTLTGGKLAVISAVEGGRLRGGDGHGTYIDSDNWGGSGGNGLLVRSTGVLTLTDKKVTLQGGNSGAGNSSVGEGLYAFAGTVTLAGVICQGGTGNSSSSAGFGVRLSSDVTVDGAINCTAQGGTNTAGLFCMTSATISGGSYTGGGYGAKIASGQKKVIVTGGTFTGGSYGLHVTSGNVQLSGGTFTGDGGSAYAVYNANSGKTVEDLLAKNYAYFDADNQPITMGLTEAKLGLNTTITVAQSTITTTGGTIESSTEVSAIQDYFGGADKATVTVNNGQGTITLKTNVTLAATVEFKDTVREWTLDLNGHTLAGAQPVNAVSPATAMGITPVTLTGGKLAVISAVEGGKLRGGDGDGTYTASNSGGLGGDGLTLWGTGVLTLTDNKVTIQGGDGGAGNSGGGTGLWADKGTVTLSGVICQGGNGTGADSGGRGVHLSPSVTVADEIKCTAQGGDGAFGLLCETAAAISDGSYTGGWAGARIVSGKKKVTVTGGTFTGGTCGLNIVNGNVQLSGGTFTGDGGSAYAVYNQNSGETAADLLAENYAYFNGSDQITTGLTEAGLGLNTTITVAQSTITATGGTIASSTEVSAIQGYFGGEDKATVTVADGKGTIKLQTDVTLAATVTFSDTARAWTLDLNGHKLTGAAGESSAVDITDGKLTICDSSGTDAGEIVGGRDTEGKGPGYAVRFTAGELVLKDKVALTGGSATHNGNNGGNGLLGTGGTLTLAERADPRITGGGGGIGGWASILSNITLGGKFTGGVFTPGGSGAPAIGMPGHGSADLLAEGYGFFNHGTGEKVTWDNNTGHSPHGVTLEVRSTAPTYTITASAGTGGTISPSGEVSVKEGENQTFIITPNSNYRIYQVMADGEDQGAAAVYTFKNVTENHRISATFQYIGGSSGGSSGGDGGSSSGGGSSSAPSTTTSTTAGENGTSAATVTTDNITVSTEPGSSTVTVKPDAAAIGGAVEAAGASETNPMDVSVTVPQDTVKNELQKADVSAVRVEVVIPKAVEDNPAVRTAGVTVEKETVDAARQTGKNVTVTVREDTGAVKAVWSLDGRAMGNTAGQSTDLKLAVHTAPVQSGDPIAAPVKPPVTAAGQENGLVISLTMDGTLLSAAGLTVPATNQTAITAGSTVALYRFDPNTGTLRAVPGGVYSVDANGNVTIDIPAGTRTGEKETYVLLPVAATAQPAAQPGDSDVHTVKAGDTLNKISRQYGCRVEDLLALNPGVDIYNLRIGSDLRVR